MKTTHFPYRTFIWVMQVMLSLSAITGTTYRGDLPRSPLSRFLYSLHSSKNTSRSSFRHPPGTTYSFAYLTLGHVNTLATKASNDIQQGNIWSTKTGAKGQYNSNAKAGASNRSASSGRSYIVVAVVTEEPAATLQFASVMQIKSARVSSQSEAATASESGLFPNYEFGKPESITRVQYDFGEWEDPPDPTVPVGDGVSCLFICTLVYMALKRKTLFALIVKQNSLN